MSGAASTSQLMKLPEYDVAGPGGAPVILFVHGNSWTRKMWLPQMQSLAGSYRLIAPDLPGHGALSRARFGFEAAVHQIEQVRAEQNARPILLVGLSLGGYVAMTYARRYPEQLAGLVLAGCCVRFTGRIRLLTRLSATVFAVIGHGPFLARLSRKQVERVKASYPAGLAGAQIQAGFTYASWGHALAQMAATNFSSMLADFPRPVLLLNGELDIYNRQAEDACAAMIPDATIRTIERAGHICNLDCPDAFTAAIRAFAESLSW